MLRTVRISEIGPRWDGKRVTVAGWVSEKRDLGRIKFLIVRDRDGAIQVTWKKGQGTPEAERVIDSLRQNDVVKVEGDVVKGDIVKLGVEILPATVVVLNRCTQSIPLDVTGRIKANLDTRLDFRPLDLSRAEPKSVFLLRGEMLRLMRDFFHEQGFVEVITPKIIVSATEGGASLFKVNYFNRVAYLAQSPQLYKEQLTLSLERVFEIGQFFRAEAFDTSRHLNEFTSVDIECAFGDMYDAMDLAEGMMRFVVDGLNEVAQKELTTLGIKLPDLHDNLRRITYSQFLQKLNEKGVSIRFGDDINAESIRAITSELGGLYFITDWPEETKPFYIKAGSSGLTHSFDLMYNDLELGSGGTREENKAMLVHNITKRGLDPTNFASHLKFFDYGMPPHAGWGIGFDRVVMSLLGLDNIREVVAYPRDSSRLEP